MTGMGSWFRHHSSRPEAAARIFCLHHAGGGASAFAGWGALAPPDVDICPVQLPGRENRLAEEPLTDMDMLAGCLADAMEPLLDLPFALFGHSMGARVAYAVTTELRERSRPVPAALVVSASRAPHHPSLRPDMHTLPDDLFADELARLGGLPEAIRRSDEMMAMTMRVARADFTVLETWRPRIGDPVAADILVLGGEDDRSVPLPALQSWSDLAGGGLRLRRFPGGHFYLKERAGAVVAEAASALFRGLDPRRSVGPAGRPAARPVSSETRS